MMKRKLGEMKKEVINKEDIADDFCFVCKEGGDLRLCDDAECLKCYHPCCVGKDDSFLASDDKWVCDRHTCFCCSEPAYLYCYTCKKSVCRHCLPAADISQIKGEYGFCDLCLKVALLLEENKDYDSDGGKVDFTDMTTFEGLFVGYYHMIKDENEFELKDLHAAAERAKVRKEHQSASALEEDEEEDQMSDDDSTEDESECKRMQSKKRSKGKKSAIQTPIKSSKLEFSGWASRSLVEFLTSIGKSTEEKMLQYEVTAIINKYVIENKLLHPEKKKWIMCDARLRSLFRKSRIRRYSVHELLEPHFAENYEESEEDDDAEDGKDEACKRQQRELEMDVEDNVDPSCFASIVAENIKLIYLNRSLVHELLKQPETFEEKVIGCFVRVKSNPHDISTRNHYQLKQVEGVKRVLNDENHTEVVLLISAIPKETSIDLISECDFFEIVDLLKEKMTYFIHLIQEECEELRQKMVAGELKRLTVRDLQRKANILHEDRTKNWINRELNSLQRRIDHANDKGWRQKFHELLEKRKRLQTPSEQANLLKNVPKVIPEVRELNSTSEGIKNDEGSSRSILPVSEEKTRDNITSTKPLQRTADEPKENELKRVESEGMCSQETKRASKTESSSSNVEYGNRAKFDDVGSAGALEGHRAIC